MTANTRKPVAERRTSQAVEQFEKAIKALGKKEFDKARELFEAVVTGFPEEREVVERARSYQVLCDRALTESKRAAYKPKAFDELLAYGVFLHNRGEYEEALRSLRQAADLQPKNENALYCLAATSARAGDNESALKALRSAISASAETRAQARRDSDFDGLREDDEFNALVYEQA